MRRHTVNVLSSKQTAKARDFTALGLFALALSALAGQAQAEQTLNTKQLDATTAGTLLTPEFGVLLRAGLPSLSLLSGVESVESTSTSVARTSEVPGPDPDLLGSLSTSGSASVTGSRSAGATSLSVATGSGASTLITTTSVTDGSLRTGTRVIPDDLITPPLPGPFLLPSPGLDLPFTPVSVSDPGVKPNRDGPGPVVPYDVVLPDIVLPDVTLPDVTLPEVTLPPVILPDPALRRTSTPAVIARTAILESSLGYSTSLSWFARIGGW